MRIGIDASRAFGSQRTGTENYSYEMIRHILALNEGKTDTFILYVRTPPSPSLIKEGDRGGVRVRVVVIPLKFLWTQVGLAFRTWVDRLDVLWVPAHTLPVFRKPGLKTIVTIHGIEYEWLPAYESWLQRWYLPLSTHYAVLNAHKIIAVSQFTKDQVVERLGGNPNKIEVVHEGVTTSPLAPLLSKERGIKRGEVLKKYGLQSQKYLLFIGTVQPRKNLPHLIQAFARVVIPSEQSESRDPSTSVGMTLRKDIKLVIAGKLGWNYDEVLTAPKRFGIEAKVKILGYVDDIERDILLRYALAYIQPSITEGFGLPIVEAWRAGVPVVSSWGGALEEIITSPFPLLSKERENKGEVKEAGLLFDPFDVNDMSLKIALVIDSHKLRQELIDKGKKRVGEFSWNQAAVKTYNILCKWK